jgi:hypothetical protein
MLERGSKFVSPMTEVLTEPENTPKDQECKGSKAVDLLSRKYQGAYVEGTVHLGAIRKGIYRN